MNIICEETPVGTPISKDTADQFASSPIPVAPQRFRPATLPNTATAESAAEIEELPIDSPRGDACHLYLREIGQVKLLTPEQEIALAERVTTRH